MVDFITPMKAKRLYLDYLEEVSDDTRWAAGLKHDGYREQLHLLNTGNTLSSAEGNDHLKGVPQFTKVIPELHDTIFDCEGLAPTRRLEDNGTCFKTSAYPEFAIAWQKEYGLAFLEVFDILKYKGLYTLDLPFYKRRVLLENAFAILTKSGMPVHLEQLVMTGKLAYFHQVITRPKEQGHEGIMLKDMQAPYKPGARGPAWKKIKRFETLICKITGFLDSASTDKYEGQIGSVVYVYKGCVGSSSGLNDDLRLDMTKHPEKYVNRLAWFQCQEVTDAGVMRSPSYKGLLTDQEVKQYGA